MVATVESPGTSAAPSSPIRSHMARSSSQIACASSRRASASGSPRFTARSARRSMRVRAQRRLTAVGRVAPRVAIARRAWSSGSFVPAGLLSPRASRPWPRRSRSAAHHARGATRSPPPRRPPSRARGSAPHPAVASDRADGSRPRASTRWGWEVAWGQDTLMPPFQPEHRHAVQHPPVRGPRRGRDRHHQPSRQAQCAERDRHRRAGRRGRPSPRRARHRGGDPHRSGTKAFVAGADIGEIAAQGPVDGKARSLEGQRVFRAPGAVRQAGDRRGQRVRAGRRLRAGDGLPPARRQRRRPVRPAGGQARHRPGIRRHGAAAQAGRPGPGAGAAPHRPA